MSSPRTPQPKYQSNQYIVGQGSEGWEVLGAVDPFVLITPKTFFRKVLRPKAPHDYGFYYNRVVIVRPWSAPKAGAVLGTFACRVDEEKVVTDVYAAGTHTHQKTETGLVYYQVAIIYDIGEGNV